MGLFSSTLGLNKELLAASADRSDGDMLVCRPDVQRWGYLVTDAYRMAMQADHDAWRGLRTYGSDTNREVAGDQFIDLLGSVLATPLRVSLTSQSLTVRDDRSLAAPPEWRSSGARSG